MELKVQQYVGGLLKKAEYDYDASVKSWCGWIPGFPGVYAQGDTIEETRSELISALEDYLLVSLSKGETLPRFEKYFAVPARPNRQYAKAH